MLNGKFYTGLTAKQIDRCGGNGQNRQESHFFWPDDSRAESAAETRLKRRASLQYEQLEKPRIQRQASVEECDAITKSRFHREFANSSIQFYDNIQEQPENDGGSHQGQSRAQAILRAKTARREIAAKPTATRLQLPEKVIDEEYTAAKKQENYHSNIKFYDYPDEELNNSNKNKTKKLLDMNDKRELERNAKNSPKLQIKRNVSDFSNVEEDVPEVKVRNDIVRTDVRNIRSLHAEKKGNNVFQDEVEDYRVRQTYADRKQRITYRNEEKSPRSAKVRQNNGYPKYQNNIQQRPYRQKESNEPTFYADEDQADINYIENNMRNVRINSSRPAKHVTYQDDFEDDHMDDVDHCYEGQHARTASNFNRGAMQNSPKQRPGSNKRQQQFRPKSPPEYYDENTNTEVELQYMETNKRPTTITTAKNNNKNLSGPNYSNKSDDNKNNSTNYNDNSNNMSKNQKAQRQISPKMSTTTILTAAAAASTSTATTTATVLESSEPTASAHKHLRSNIFLNDSIPTSTTPTPKFRRNAARNSAVGRVSVGLPD